MVETATAMISTSLAAEANTIETAASVAEAVGTVSAVFVALFLQVFLIKHRQPRLSMTFSVDDAEDDVVAVDDIEGTYSLWFRLKVHNRKKKDLARNVQVLLLRVVKPLNEESQTATPSRNLKWADTPAEHLPIPGGTWRRVDALVLYADAKKQASPRLGVVLGTYIQPWEPTSREQLTITGRYRLDLAVVADNCEANFWSLAFDYEPEPVSCTGDLRGQVRNLELKPLPRL